MGKSLILAVKIIGDASSAISAMDQAAGKADGFGRGLDKAAKWAAAGLVAIGAGAAVAVSAASDLEQSTGAVSSVFGEYSGQMMKYAEGAADALGLSQNQYAESASILGAQLKNMGLSVEEAAGQTDGLITMGADLAATFGGSTSDAVSALSALMRGERDPIERYGVSIKQADIDAQKAAMGLDGLTGEAAKNADMQATLALLTAQTADAQGQFAREAGSAAGSAQIASANFENAKAALGQALLPIVTEVSEKLAELAKWFQQNAEWITPLVGVIAALAAGIIIMNAAYKAFAAVQAIQTAAQWAQNAAWLASPITWIVLAIILAIGILIAIIVLVVKHWDKIKEAGINAWNAVIGWIQQAIEWVKVRVIQAIMVAVVIWSRIKQAAADAWNAVISWVRSAIDWVQNRIVTAIMKPITAFYQLRDGAISVFQSIIAWVQNALSWLSNLASRAVPGWAKKLFGLSAFAAPITPEVSAFSAPDYAARMMITPQVEAFTPLSLQATAGVADPTSGMAAPLASSNFAAMLSLTTSLMQAAANRSSTGTQVVYEDRSEHHYHFDNYLGDKNEIIEQLDEAIEERRRKSEGLTRV